MIAITLTAPGMISTEPGSLDQVVSMVTPVMTFIKNGQYLMAGAAITLVVVFLLKAFVLPKLNLSTSVLPILSAGLGLVTGLSISILGGATPLQAMIAMGSGPAASLLWDTILKHLLPPKPDGSAG